MIPVNIPRFDGKEKEYLIECIDTGWISSEGPFVKKFEEQFANYSERKFGISVANGSVALDIAVEALGIRKGDEVIMPTFTIISCAAAVIRAGATPIFVDSDPKTWNMNVGQIEPKITSKTKAIMVVHIYGLPCEMEPILKIANKYGLKIIEDAAEMHGQTYNGKKCGSFGDLSTFSFYANKHISTGEGGMILTNNKILAEDCRSLRNLCFKPERRFVHDRLGWNYRMSNIQAAIGLAQLENIDKILKRKREIGQLYNSFLKNLKSIETPLEETEYAKNVYWVYGIIVKNNSKIKYNEIIKKLEEKKIGVRPFFWCMHEQPVFNKMGLYKGESFPIAENFARNGFYVPSGVGTTNDQIEKVATSILEILDE